MKFRLAFIIEIPVIAALLFSCNNSGNLIGIDHYQNRFNTTPHHCMLPAAGSDTSYQAVVATGSGPYLFVGESDEITCMSLILFDIDPDSNVLDSATVTLQLIDVIGTSSSQFALNIHILQTPWEESDTEWGAFSSAYLGEPDSTVILTISELPDDTTDVSFRFHLPLPWIKHWQDTLDAIPNYGMAFTTDASFIAVFGSAESSDQPLLSVYSHAEGDTSVIDRHTYPMHDVFIPGTFQESTSDFLYVSNGLGFRSLLYFDISSIPETATINQAQIHLKQDSTLTFPHWNAGSNLSLTCVSVTETPWPFPEIPYDSLYTGYGLAYGDSAVINITTLVQLWSSGEKQNHGVMIKGTSEAYDISGAAFYTTASDSLNRPFLELYYSVPDMNNGQ